MSKKTRREFLKMTAVAGAGALLGACAPQATPTPVVIEKEKTVIREVEKVVMVTPTPAVKKPVRLTAWFADRRTINLMTQEIIKTQFEARYPHITVEVMYVPEAQIPAKMATAYAANQAPDIAALDETQLPGFLKQNFVHPIPPEEFDVAKAMGRKAADFYQIPPGPAYYALPNGNMPCLMYYNTALLEKFGYKAEDVPVKWDDFIKWAKDLTIWEGDEIKQWGFTFVGTPWFWDSVGYQKGGWLFKNAKKSMLDDPINQEAYQFTLDLLDVHKLDVRTAPLTPQDRVGQGMAVTGVQFGFGFGFLETTYPETRFGTLPLPSFTGKPIYGRASDDLGFCVTTQKKSAEELEAVWTLFRYLLGPDYQKRYVVLRGLQPSLLELTKLDEFSVKNPKWYGVAMMTTPGNYHADGVWPAEVTPLIHQDLWERIVNKGEPIATVMADHTAKIDKILAEMDLPLLNGKEGWRAEWEKPEA